MAERKIILTKEDCACYLEDFYENVAIKAGFSPSQKSARYDSGKICVPAEVFGEIKASYIRQGYRSMMVAAIWVVCGPKTECDSDPEHPYYAVIQDGFYTEEGEN